MSKNQVSEERKEKLFKTLKKLEDEADQEIELTPQEKFKKLERLATATNDELRSKHDPDRKADNSWAQYELAQCYETGIFLGQKIPGLKIDIEKAQDLYERAAIKKNLKAKERLLAKNPTSVAGYYRMGLMLEMIYQDFELAAKYYETAADGGHPIAQHKIAKYYLTGKANVEKNLTQATKFLLKSAAQDDLDAELDLALIFLNAENPEKDYVQGADMLERLAKNNQANNQIKTFAQFHYARCLHRGLGVPRNIGNANKIFAAVAPQLETLALTTGSVTAMHLYGLCLENGHGVEQNIGRAMQYHASAAKFGNEDSKIKLVEFAAKKLGEDKKGEDKKGEDKKVKEQPQSGSPALTDHKAAEKDQLELAILFLNKENPQNNPAEAVKILKKLATDLNAGKDVRTAAQFRLAYYFDKEEKDQPNLDGAIKYYTLAGAAGNSAALERAIQLSRIRYGKPDNKTGQQPGTNPEQPSGEKPKQSQQSTNSTP